MAVTLRAGVVVWVAMAALTGPAVADRAAAAERFALVVSGASGSAEHAATYAGWRQALVDALVGPLEMPAEHVVVLEEGAADASRVSTAERVRAAVGQLAGRMTAADTLLVVLLGHGTFDGVDAKFNLVGPDLEADDWRSLLTEVPGRLVFVNTASASAPFMERLAGPRRIVVTATDTAAQQYDTVFGDFFGSAFTTEDADLDKDGRVSIGEAFAYASGRVKRYYAERGQLATERALLDDTGDGRGQEAGTQGPDGAIASRTFLDAGPEVASSGDPALSELLARRESLEAALDELKRKKEFMPTEDYARELERLLLEHARLSRQIRPRS